MSQPLPAQYSILETFSADSMINIQQVGLNVYGNYRNSFYSPIITKSVVTGDSDRLVPTIAGTIINLSGGKCEILGILIEILADMVLNTNNSNSYIFDTDDIPYSIPGSGTSNKLIYCAVYYNPIDESHANASVGLIINDTFITNNIVNLCVLFAINATLTDNLVTYLDPEIDYTCRNVLFDIFDGGEE